MVRRSDPYERHLCELRDRLAAVEARPPREGEEELRQQVRQLLGWAADHIGAGHREKAHAALYEAQSALLVAEGLPAVERATRNEQDAIALEIDRTSRSRGGRATRNEALRERVRELASEISLSSQRGRAQWIARRLGEKPEQVRRVLREEGL